jgi:2-polyprenyl-3-methyl-5-hydroxy-6-metoxy-1,4-benzoquinol methylase
MSRAGLISDTTPQQLTAELGGIDIYLLDQILRGRIRPGMRIFDAGCGGGRNLVWFLRNGFEVLASDADSRSVAVVRELAARLAPELPAQNFRAESLEETSFDDHCADVVISSAVLHLAHTDDQFSAMLHGSWRVLRPGGLFFARLASTIGMEDRFRSIDGRWSALPDGSERYLVDEAMLLALTRDLGAELLDPIKTTVVQDQRCMTTWVVRKESTALDSQR